MIVYKITNKITGKSYIGITKYTAHKRWKKHLERVLEGINTALYCAIRKYGTSAFDIKTIYEAINELEALKVESGLIASHNTLIPNGYNMTAGGSNPFGHDKVKGAKQWKAILTDDIVKFIRNPLLAHLTNQQIVNEVNEKFGLTKITQNVVNSSRAGRTWKHLNINFPPICPGLGGRTKAYMARRAR